MNPAGTPGSRLWAVEGHSPDRRDVVGATICLTGAAVILFAPRTTA